MYQFEAVIWRWRDGPMHFLTLPEDAADEIDERTAVRRGFGSVRVEVTIGASTWRTSIFPSKELASFILPVKKAIRIAEGCEEGDVVRVELATFQ